MDDQERARAAQLDGVPAPGERASAPAHVEAVQLEAPQERRGVDQRPGAAARREVRIVDRERTLRVALVDVEQRQVPPEVTRQGGVARPGRACTFEERDALGRPAAHLAHVREDVDRSGTAGLERERTTGGGLGRVVIAVLLEAERMHRENVAEAGVSRVPVRQRGGDAVAQHRARAEAKVERVRDAQRDEVAGKVRDEVAVTRECGRFVAVAPRRRGRRVAPRAGVARRIALDRRNRAGEPLTVRRIVAEDERGGAQRMSHGEAGDAFERAVDRPQRIALAGDQAGERGFERGHAIGRGAAKRKTAGIDVWHGIPGLRERTKRDYAFVGHAACSADRQTCPTVRPAGRRGRVRPRGDDPRRPRAQTGADVSRSQARAARR